MEKCCGNCLHSFCSYASGLQCGIDQGGWGGNTFSRDVRSDFCCDRWSQDPDMAPAETPQRSAYDDYYEFDHP